MPFRRYFVNLAFVFMLAIGLVSPQSMLANEGSDQEPPKATPIIIVDENQTDSADEGSEDTGDQSVPNAIEDKGVSNIPGTSDGGDGATGDVVASPVLIDEEDEESRAGIQSDDYSTYDVDFPPLDTPGWDIGVCQAGSSGSNWSSIGLPSPFHRTYSYGLRENSNAALTIYPTEGLRFDINAVEGVVLSGDTNWEIVEFSPVRLVLLPLPGPVTAATVTIPTVFVPEESSSAGIAYMFTWDVLACPGLPQIVPTACVDGLPTEPMVMAPESTDFISYSEPTYEDVGGERVFSLVARELTRDNEFFAMNVFETFPGNWSYANLNGEGVAVYTDSTPLLENPCVPVESADLQLSIDLSVCQDGIATAPAVTAPEIPGSVTYSEVSAVESEDNVTYTGTATANVGYTFQGVSLPQGWSAENPSEAIFEITIPIADCEIPLQAVTPAVPTLVVAICGSDNQPVPPTLTVPETDGITYSDVTTSPANSVLLSLTATANNGYTFEGVKMPEGWILVSSTEALYELVAEETSCPTKTPTPTPAPETPTPPTEISTPAPEPLTPPAETPTPASETPTPPTEISTPAPETLTPTAETPTPTEISTPASETPTPTSGETPSDTGTSDPTEAPKAEEKAIEVSKLPETGTGSSPASLIGLAASVAAALAGAGIFASNRKR